MKTLDTKKAVVVFSGGQDSTTCLGWAISKYGVENVMTVTYHYGQTHSVEVDVAKRLVQDFKLHPGNSHFIDVTAMRDIGDSALVTGGDVNEMKDGLPASFVPGRNLIFLTHAAQLAYCYGYANVITGVCETDYSGYPDCRDNFVKSLQATLNLAMDSNIRIHTPLMWLNKAETWEMAGELGIMDEVLYSHTCYNGNRMRFQDWGYGCGDCPACKVRESGYREYRKGKL